MQIYQFTLSVFDHNRQIRKTAVHIDVNSES